LQGAYLKGVKISEFAAAHAFSNEIGCIRSSEYRKHRSEGFQVLPFANGGVAFSQHAVVSVKRLTCFTS